MSGHELAVLLVQKGSWAAVATVGFSVLFNVPKYALPYCALIGAFGYALRIALMSGGMGMILATLCAALLIGVLATILAQRFEVLPRDGYKVEPVCRLTLRPKGGLPARVVARAPRRGI